MHMDYKFAVVGGDMRQIKMAEHLETLGYVVSLCGFDGQCSEIKIGTDIVTAIKDADVVVLGLPASTDKTSVNTPFYGKKIYIDDLLAYMKRGALLCGGMICDAISTKAKKRGVRCTDYFEREELAVLNAIPTAEGAIQIAMEEIPITLHGAKALVVGYGRIGKILARMLRGIGACVTCSARACSDIAWIEADGHTPVKTADIAHIIGQYDIVFNTVPYPVIGKEQLRALSAETLIIDLASKPGGVDFELAKDLGINVIWALSIPGKVAPISSGKIIASTILNILNS